jgi:hypothetical protein
MVNNHKEKIIKILRKVKDSPEEPIKNIVMQLRKKEKCKSHKLLK